MNRLQGKVALITGGNSGIGMAVAERFAAEGAQVIATGRRQDVLDEAVRRIGHGAIGIRGDVADIQHHAAVAGEIRTRTLIIASGASARWLGIPSEQALIGHGVSSCSTCDGFFFRGKPIAVVGGGDSAMEEALFLTRFASKVTLLHRRDAFRASKIMLERTMAHPNIELRTNTVVDEVLGVEDKSVKGLKLRDTVNGETCTLDVEGLFLGIGHEPNAKMFHGQIDLDEEGYIKTTGNVLTTRNGQVVPGVYAAGDVQDRRYRQAITAAGSGCMAALEAEKFLEEHGH